MVALENPADDSYNGEQGLRLEGTKSATLKGRLQAEALGLKPYGTKPFMLRM